MSTKSLLHQARLNEWAFRCADQKANGFSVTGWCEQNNLSKHKLFLLVKAYSAFLLKQQSHLHVTKSRIKLYKKYLLCFSFA